MSYMPICSVSKPSGFLSLQVGSQLPEDMVLLLAQQAKAAREASKNKAGAGTLKNLVNRWPPSDVSWFISPSNYTINHSYWSYK